MAGEITAPQEIASKAAMENASYIALSRQMALMRQLDTVANNMANANTPAYKGEQMMFREYLMKAKSPDKTFGDKVSFVQDVGLLRNTSDGPIAETGNPLDLALEGDGYFVIDTPQGPRYTRNGHFRLDEGGMMVTTEGYAVMQTGDQPVVFAPNESQVTISRDGTIATENGPIGKLKVVKFENDQTLQKAGAGLYETTSEATEMQRPEVLQGMVENSNVQTVQEVTNMIEILRNYEGAQKLLDNEHERQLKAINTLGQPRSA